MIWRCRPTGAARAYLFDSVQCEKKLEDEELYDWLFKLALSRSGVLGTLDIINQSLTGLLCERDPPKRGFVPNFGAV